MADPVTAENGRAVLNQLLAACRQRLVANERFASNEMIDFGQRPVVLFGASSLGAYLARKLKTLGLSICAFVDNNPSKHGQSLEGLRVLSVDDGIRLYGNSATWVVAVWRDSAVLQQLKDANCRAVSFIPVMWKYAELCLPYFSLGLPSALINNECDVRRGFDLMEDDVSRRIYIEQLEFRLATDFTYLSERTSIYSTGYFTERLFTRYDDERFVDLGAYDGDTLLEFLREYANFHSALLCEADQSNFAMLENTIAELPSHIRAKVEAMAVAVGANNGTIRFSASGDVLAKISSDGPSVVRCVTLDSIAERFPPTLVKMDIEGSERDALAGATAMIAKHRPVLAISAYHCHDDLWRIPLTVATFPEYAILLRQQRDVYGDVVCYAIPRERLITPA
jgi:FkbM family methyltransferase